MMETGGIIYHRVCASPRPPPKISFKDTWMKELGSEVDEGSEEQPSGSLTQEIGKDVLFGCGSPNASTVRPVNGPPVSQSCVPVSVELVDKDEDKDEDVDADQTRTERLVSGQPIGLFTQLEDTDIDFIVSGLPHAVVKQAENFRVREFVKMIESHPHQDALQAGKITSTTHSVTIRKR